MWGFITVINNTLLPHLRSVFDLYLYPDNNDRVLVWFIAYFVASIPAAKLIERIGYKKSLVTGLSIMREQVFERFFRATHEGNGCGLGLIVKEIVERHGGRIVRRRPGRAACASR